MAINGAAVYPWETRDKEEQSRAEYNTPLRREHRSLAEENLRLKRLLRENGIPWSSLALSHIKQRDPKCRKTRSSVSSVGLAPRLPVEILLRILRLSLMSPHPIIDPLCSLDTENLSDEEKARGNQVAIHFLATCKAMNVEGTRIFWQSNHFVFTSHQALRNFANLSLDFRRSIKQVSFRIVARYYDDQRRRPRHRLDRGYHPDLYKDQLLKVQMRPLESPLHRPGFRCYTWNQLSDFLLALRAPWDPTFKDKKVARPRLLPSLEVLKIDLVNFSDNLLPFSGAELHEVASHELGCTINELHVTGMPDDDPGMKAAAELSGMLKDEGLYLDAVPRFLAHSRFLQPLSDKPWCARVIRASKEAPDEMEVDEDEEEVFMGTSDRSHMRMGSLPAAPSEAPPEGDGPDDTLIWKLVPTSRDSGRRSLVAFKRSTGYRLGGNEEDKVCPCCGESHPGSSFLDFLEDEMAFSE